MHTTLKQLKRLTAIAYANLGQSEKRQKKTVEFYKLSSAELPIFALPSLLLCQGTPMKPSKSQRRKSSKFQRTTLFVPWSLGHCSVLSKGGCKMSDEWLDLMIWVFESLKLNVSIKFEYFNLMKIIYNTKTHHFINK